tara:strand:- start:1699 stop:1977 length:279 start_codon:yes stop_codon:yes gene_type:complete
MSNKKLLIALSDNYIKTFRILVKIAFKNVNHIYDINQLNLKGRCIYILYKYICNQNIDDTINYLNLLKYNANLEIYFNKKKINLYDFLIEIN